MQNLADSKGLFPDECGSLQSLTLATSDPCGCRDYDGTDCDPPGFTNTQTCNLCGGNKRIGDPDRIIPTGILQGAKCIDAFDDGKYGAFVTVCSQAQNLIQSYCRCVSPGVYVKPCIPLESEYCDRSDSSDRCCAGSCKYLKSKGGYRCTERAGDTPPANYAPPKGGLVACFTGDMQVTTRTGNVAMRDLALGDRVLTGAGTFEPIYSFGHKHDYISATFLQIHTDRTSALEISKDHMVFTSKAHAVPASALKEGDALLLPNGEFASIQSIRDVKREGMYAPFTLSGSVVVNGIVASSYVGLQDTSAYLRLGKYLQTPLTLQWLAHVFESPHRLAFRLGFVEEQYTRQGVSHWVNFPFLAANWLMKQNSFVMVLIVLPLLAVFGFIWCLEQHLLTALVALSGILLLTRSKSLTKARRMKMTC